MLRKPLVKNDQVATLAVRGVVPANKEYFMPHIRLTARSLHGALRWLSLPCLLLLAACAPQHTTPTRHQYSIVRYHDSLSDFHSYRSSAREVVAYSTRGPFSPGQRPDFTPVPNEELDDGDMEATPDLLQEPSLYPTLALLKPVSDDLRITSPFGVRVHPLKRRRLMHAGVDIAGKRGEKVVASAPGTIIHSGRKGSYGLTVDIEAGNGVILRYAHLDKIGVRKGQKVKRGQYIGNLGRTGRVTAAHLHFEVRLHDKPINPLQFLSPEHHWAANTGERPAKSGRAKR